MKLSRRLSTNGGIYLPKQHRLQLLWLAGTLLIVNLMDDGGLSLYRYYSLQGYSIYFFSIYSQLLE